MRILMNEVFAFENCISHFSFVKPDALMAKLSQREKENIVFLVKPINRKALAGHSLAP